MSNIATLRDDYTIIGIVQNLGIIPRSVVVKLLTLHYIHTIIYTNINIYITPQGKKLHVAQFTLQFILMILLS